jgi:hypothetical protein
MYKNTTIFGYNKGTFRFNRGAIIEALGFINRLIEGRGTTHLQPKKKNYRQLFSLVAFFLQSKKKPRLERNKNNNPLPQAT